MALKVGLGISTEVNPYFAGKSAALKSLNSLGVDIPEFGLCFYYHEYPPLQVFDGIKSSLGERNLVVLASQINICNDHLKKRSVILSLFSGHSYHSAITLVNNVSKDPYISGHHLAWGMLNSLGEKTGKREVLRKFALIFVTDSFFQKGEFLKGIQEVLGIRFPIVGGIISAQGAGDPGYLTFNREGGTDSAVGILFGGESLIVGIGCYHGWIPLGLAKKVKKTENNRILDLEDLTPLKYYIMYLGKNIDILEGNMDEISILYPLGMEMAKGEYIIRFPRALEPGGSISLDSPPPEGGLIRLMMGIREELLNAVQFALMDALKPLEEEKATPSLILIISAIERKEILGIDINQEINLVRKKVPDSCKIIGMYTHGQFAPFSGGKAFTQSTYHNGAIVIIAMGIKR